MMPVYIVLITYIYGTFENESQWGVQASPADIYTPYICIYVYIYISQILTDAKFDVESDGIVYLASQGHPCFENS